ncbi:MAG: zinc metalloprotease HtpX [Chlamydiales bacterium]
MRWNQTKTVFLLGSLTGLLFLIGYWIGGSTGVIIAFFFSLVMNLYSYFYSDKLVLSMYKAQPLDPERFDWIYQMVEELAQDYQIPMPKLWFVPTDMANAFATGRNPEHASVAVTAGILNILDRRELRGVLAHELGHVKNRDILVSTIAVVIASAIGLLANMLHWSALLGGGDGERRGGGALSAILIAIIMPVAASLIQMAISRSREYLADESGAHACEDPLALASALEKLEMSAKQQQVQPVSATQATTASLFIVYPFLGKGISRLFSTHPPMDERIARLKKIAKDIHQY